MNLLDVVTVGESMIAFEALDYGPIREAKLFNKWVGGAETDFAIGLARLGFKCGWFSRLGDDEFGREVFRTIRGEDVDVSKVIFDLDAKTGVFFVERSSLSDFKCYFYRQASAASQMSPDDVDPDYIKQAKIVYLTGITPVLSESANKVVEKVYRVALKNNQTIVFDPNLRLTLCSINTARSLLIPLMQKSTYVLPGDEELKLLMDCPELPKAIEKAHSMGIGNLVIKAGVEGAILACANEKPRHVPSYNVRPISSIGAGDCFGAGFVAGLLEEQPMEQSVRWGNALGAFSLMAWGPYQALPNYQEFQAFLSGESGILR